MELTQLRYFIAAAEEEHFGRAARRSHITQPPLSIQIKKLEEELGVQLFKRSNRSVTLTPEGDLFLREARAIVTRANHALRAMRELSDAYVGSLNIGFNEPAINSFLPAALGRFRNRRPDVVLSLNELETARQLECLRRFDISAGFVRLFEHDESDLEKRLISSEGYVAALPANHPLARLDEVEPSLLRDDPLVIFPRRLQPRLYDRFMRELKSLGYVPTLIQEAITKQTTLALVEAGLGVAFVPESIARHPREGVAFRPCSGNFPAIHIHAVWRKNDPSPLLEDFLDCLPI